MGDILVEVVGRYVGNGGRKWWAVVGKNARQSWHLRPTFDVVAPSGLMGVPAWTARVCCLFKCSPLHLVF